jgi:hypothetical protein
VAQAYECLHAEHEVLKGTTDKLSREAQAADAEITRLKQAANVEFTRLKQAATQAASAASAEITRLKQAATKKCATVHQKHTDALHSLPDHSYQHTPASSHVGLL